MAVHDSQGISWQILAIVAGMAIPLVVGAVQLGGVQNQVAINTERLARLETFKDILAPMVEVVRQRQVINEQRLTGLESWKDAALPDLEVTRQRQTVNEGRIAELLAAEAELIKEIAMLRAQVDTMRGK